MSSEDISAAAQPHPSDNEAIGSMEEQLVSLYTERVSLEREIGKSDATEILNIFRTLNDRINQLEVQVDANARVLRILEREFGTIDPLAIVSRVRSLNDLVSRLEERVAQLPIDHSSGAL